ncbi:RYamide receptor isoform X2 [Plutella xylostella]|uniref:RYamide receptor isoform X2 n=1 Tax=Plutella xylostella TaxID=51655 RepID=UPI002032AE58|nr:RYamide receptor isoform X2 [Plutella xylostella]
MLETDYGESYNEFDRWGNWSLGSTEAAAAAAAAGNDSADREATCGGGALLAPALQAAVYFLYSSIFVVALLGNGLVCLVVAGSPRMKTVTNYFIVNLAVGDMLMTLLCVPFSFVSTLLLRHWPFGGALCKAVNYSQAVSVLVSAYTLLAISVDRYMAIMRPLQPRLGRGAAKLVVAAVWGGALATAAPIAAVSTLQRPSEWHQYCEFDICMEQWSTPEQSAQYTWALLGLQFALPLGALVGTYSRIALAVWDGRPPGEAHSARDSRMQRSKRKMIKMMVTVVAVFTVCWLPLNIFIVLWTVHEHDDSWSLWPGMPYLWFASHWLAMSHTCYNPLIYCYMNHRYRRGFKQILCSLVCVKREKVGCRSCQRSSVYDGVPMSELVGVTGIGRRATVSSSVSRARSCACAGGRRAGSSHHAPPRDALLAPPATPAPPPRALSVRSHFD